MTPNESLQLTVEHGPRLATPSLGPRSTAAELWCYVARGSDVSTSFHPEASIVPLFSRDPTDPHRYRFAGTGFFVESELLATADHVLGDSGSLSMGIVQRVERQPSLERSKLRLLELETVHRAKSVDLALLRCRGHQCPYPLALDTSPLLGIEQVYCYEYSRSFMARSGDFFAEASTRIGNVVRYIDDLREPPTFPPNCLELSFPAVRGASGAPVLAHRDRWVVVGIVKTNVSYELLPIETTRVVDEIDEKPISEEVKYYLPQGLAVNPLHLQQVMLAATGRQAT